MELNGKLWNLVEVSGKRENVPQVNQVIEMGERSGTSMKKEERNYVSRAVRDNGPRQCTIVVVRPTRYLYR